MVILTVLCRISAQTCLYSFKISTHAKYSQILYKVTHCHPDPLSYGYPVIGAHIYYSLCADPSLSLRLFSLHGLPHTYAHIFTTTCPKKCQWKTFNCHSLLTLTHASFDLWPLCVFQLPAHPASFTSVSWPPPQSMCPGASPHSLTASLRATVWSMNPACR